MGEIFFDSSDATDSVLRDSLIAQYKIEIEHCKKALSEVFQRSEKDLNMYSSDGIAPEAGMSFVESRNPDIQFWKDRIQLLQAQLKKLEDAQKLNAETNEPTIN